MTSGREIKPQLIIVICFSEWLFVISPVTPFSMCASVCLHIDSEIYRENVSHTNKAYTQKVSE